MKITTSSIKHTTINTLLAAGLIMQTHAFAQVSPRPIQEDQEAAARKQWHDSMSKQPMLEAGCFHATYPSYVWEKAECKAPREDVQAPMQTVGNGADFTEISDGIIHIAQGTFSTSDVKSVMTTGAGCTYLGAVCDGVNGNGQYTIQLNSNNDQWTSACDGGSSKCRVWQQFVYASQYYYSDLNIIGLENSPALFIQYWLINYGDSCPKSSFGKWNHTASGSCWKNGPHASPPYFPVSELGNVTMVAVATPGGQDIIELFHKRVEDTGKVVEDVWSVTDKDNFLQIGTVWRDVEFNVFGNGGGSEAIFNNGASINGMVELMDSSGMTPLCSNSAGTTAETNNLTMRECTTSVLNGHPTIKYTEQTESAIIHQPPGNPIAH